MSRFTLVKMAVPLCAALACGAASASAAPILSATLASFAVLGASDVTCVAPCVIGGNVGSHPTAPTSPEANFSFSFGSFQPGTQGTAQTDLDLAIGDVNAFLPDATVTGGDLDAFQIAQGGVIGPGTYVIPAATSNLVGDLILDGGGNASAVWVFQTESTLITDNGSTISVVDVGDGSNVGVYWSVASSATINGDTFLGNVLAGASITSDGGLTLGCGRLLAATGNVTLIMDTISIGCGAEGDTGFGSNGFDQGVENGNGTGNGNGQTVPEPGAFVLFGLGLAGLGFMRRRTLRGAR